MLHPLEESEIYHYAGGVGDGDDADDGDGDGDGDDTPSHGKKRPSTAETPGSSAATTTATGASRAERKRQRQERYGATTLPPTATATAAAGDAPLPTGATAGSAPAINVAGKSADCAAHRTAPALDDVRAHPAVGYYRRRGDAAGDATGDDDGYFYVQCPLDVVSKRNGIHACYPPPYGRPSVTKMRLVSYCAASQTSLVECQPVTGRTHQIRLHSQLAGHPIANDPCYGGELFFHDPEKQAQCRAAQTLLEACGIAPLSRVLHQPTTSATATTTAAVTDTATATTTTTTATWTLPPIERQSGESDDALLERSCRYCAALRQFPQLRDVEVHLHCDGIWLHAWQYAKTRPLSSLSPSSADGDDDSDEFWAFEAPPPAWAADTLPLVPAVAPSGSP